MKASPEDGVVPLPLTVLSEDERFFLETVRRFAAERIRPHVREMDDKAELRADILAACFELGLMGIEAPEALGGQGGSFFHSILAIEALAEVDPAVAVVVDVQNTLVLNALLNFASESQKQCYVPRLCRDWTASYALSEAGAGSDAFSLTTRAEDKGEVFELTGRKLWISNAAEASLFLVFATVDPQAGYKGVTAFLVERDLPGFTVGAREQKLGIRASSTCELILESCRVPKENVVGEVGKGYKIAIETLNEGRIGIGAQMLGAAQAAFEHARKYVAERKQFGRAIADFQAVRFQLAQTATELQAARLLVYNAARLKEAGKPFLTEAAMAKLFASELAVRVAAQAVDLHGGVGFTKDYPVEKLYRDVKIGTIYEGTSNMQLQTIAKQLLR